MDKVVDMIRFDDISVLAEEGKRGTRIIWERDGSHNIDDLQIILELDNLGFDYKIYNYEGKYEKKAIKIEFEYRG